MVSVCHNTIQLWNQYLVWCQNHQGIGEHTEAGNAQWIACLLWYRFPLFRYVNTRMSHFLLPLPIRLPTVQVTTVHAGKKPWVSVLSILVMFLTDPSPSNGCQVSKAINSPPPANVSHSAHFSMCVSLRVYYADPEDAILFRKECTCGATILAAHTADVFIT